MCLTEPLTPADSGPGWPGGLDSPVITSSFIFYGEDSPRARFVSSPAAQLGGFAEHM
jgi:hypothetical protein